GGGGTGRGGPRRGRAGGGDARPLGDALPQAAPRRQGAARHPHQRPQRDGGGSGVGPRRRRHHADHDAGHGEPHPRQRDPADGPEHAGGADHEHGRGGQGSVAGQGGEGRRRRGGRPEGVRRGGDGGDVTAFPQADQRLASSGRLLV